MDSSGPSSRLRSRVTVRPDGPYGAEALCRAAAARRHLSETSASNLD